MDPNKENSAANSREIASGEIRLDSTPQYVTIGAHYACNARCVFCLGGTDARFNMDIYRGLFEGKMGHILKKAESIGFCGFGEILCMPDIEGFLDHLNKTLHGINKVFTTNGIGLNQKVCRKLTEDRYSVLVSLHTPYPEMHMKLTGTDCFGPIADNVRNLLAMRKGDKTKPHVNLIFIMTSINIETLPSFIAFASGIGADTVTCNYLTIFDPAQIKMSTFFMKERTNEMLRQAEIEAEKTKLTLVLPPKYFNEGAPKNNGPVCRDPWEFFYVETQGSVNPCCYAGNHIGHLDKQSFEEIWNGPGYMELREGLVSGLTHTWCKYCMKYDTRNVDDIRSHITFRPETQEKILGYIREHKNEFPSISEETEL